MRSRFTLFQSHLDLAHDYWKRLLRPGDRAIDATCGNGHDSLFLAQLALERLYVMDIQARAITATRALLKNHLDRVTFLHQSHDQFSPDLLSETIQLIVYNLGYLPGGDKTLTTNVDTTVSSLKQALTLIQPGGCISMTMYPGHTEGKKERQAVLALVSELDPERWSCCCHTWSNRKEAPELLLMQKSNPQRDCSNESNGQPHS